MNKLSIFILITLLLKGFTVCSQDLISKIPEDAQAVLSVHSGKWFDLIGKNEFKNSFLHQLLLTKLMDETDIQLSTYEDTGIDFDQTSYFYAVTTDSLISFVGLLPLRDAESFGKLTNTHSNGIKSTKGDKSYIINHRGDTHIAWDQNTVYILYTSIMDNYFLSEEVRENLGFMDYPEIDSRNRIESYDWEDASTEMEDEVPTIDLNKEVDSLMGVPSAPLIMHKFDTAIIEEVDIEAPILHKVDTLIDESVSTIYPPEDSYIDSYNLVANFNDSLKTAWLKAESTLIFDELLNSKHTTSTYKKYYKKNKNKNAVAQIWVKNVNTLYRDFIFYSTLGVLGSGAPEFMDIKRLNFGFKDMLIDFVVDMNTLKVQSKIDLEKETASYIKNIYKKKTNPAFYSFIDDQDLGFISISMDTEEYLKWLPHYYSNITGGLVTGEIWEYIDLATDLFDLLVDEKAIAQVVKGDGLFVVKDIFAREKSYIDYEYDDDWNYKEVEKTKTENLPRYVGMFSSDNPAIFEKLLKIGMRHDKTRVDGQIYEITSKNIVGIEPFILIDKGIVYLSNDKNILEEIVQNKHRKRTSSGKAKMLKKNSNLGMINVKNLIQATEGLGALATKSSRELADNFKDFENIYVNLGNMKGNTFHSELAIELPRESDNGMKYLFDMIENVLEKEYR